MGILRKIYSPGLILVVLCALGPGFFPISASAAETLRLHEQKIKAGLLYNLLKYSVWPPEVFAKGDSFHVCLYGGDAFQSALDPLQGRTAQQRIINIKKIYNLDELSACHVVFISQSQQEKLPLILETLKNHPVLTVSDIEKFSQKGGMVEFARSENRIRLHFNQSAIDRERMYVGEQLLKLAEAKR